MLNIANTLKKNLNLKLNKPYVIDNFAFKLHYRFTVILLIVSTVLVSQSELIGGNIKCMTDKGVEAKVIDTFCFFTSTYTVVKYLGGNEFNYPGIGPVGVDNEEPIKKHAYYQWVPFVLFIQGLGFYVPHLIWKKLEGGRIKTLVQGLEFAAYATDASVNVGSMPTKIDVETKFAVLSSIFFEKFAVIKFWPFWLIFCEFLNLLHLILQITLTEVFLAGDFLQLGPKVFETNDQAPYILDEVFPKMTKCTFKKYGPSGTIQSHDAFCVVPMNIINEKIFTFLWFWYCFLFIVSVLVLVWRLMAYILHSRSMQFSKVVYGMDRPKLLDPWKNVQCSKESRYVDWLFLKYLDKNMDPLVFVRFLESLAQSMD